MDGHGEFKLRNFGRPVVAKVGKDGSDVLGIEDDTKINPTDLQAYLMVHHKRSRCAE